MLKNHTSLLNFLIENFDLKTYCEIGVQFKHHNFNIVQIHDVNKIGIDPDPNAQATYQMTSDEYFEKYKQKFDLIFVDGLHHSDQLQRDFENSLTCLNDNGFIVIHDCNPIEEIHTQVPRNGLRGVWLGDVYKFVCCLGNDTNVNFRTVDFDHGCCIVWKTQIMEQRYLYVNNVDWKFFQNNKQLLRLIPPIEDTILSEINKTYKK